jgi:hypothetical protein
MTAVLCCIAAMATLAQANPPVTQAGPPAAPKIEVRAFTATNTGQATRQVDATLRGLDALLKEMPYDTFLPVMQQQAELAANAETMVTINETYALYVLPIGPEEEGMLPLQARVTMLQGGRPVNALVTQGKAKPGRAMLFRGLEIPGGELGIVLRLVPPPQDPKDGDSDSEDQGDQEQEPQEPQDPSGSGDDQSGEDGAQEEAQQSEDQAGEQGTMGEEGEQQEGESAAAESPQEEGESEGEGAEAAAPKDLEDIEALLKSLEDQDRREQKSARNRRDTIRFNGDWW